MRDFSRELSEYRKRDVPCEVAVLDDWLRFEEEMGLVIPEDFKDFYGQVSQYYFEGDLPSLFGKGTDGTDWLATIARERHEVDVPMPPWLLPFCSVGNGDYHCFRVVGSRVADIVYWYGDRGPDQAEDLEVLAPDFSTWLAGYAEDRY